MLRAACGVLAAALVAFAPVLARAQEPAPGPAPAPPAAAPQPQPQAQPQPQPQPYPYPPPYPYAQPYPYPYAQPYPYPYAARPLAAEMPYDPDKPIPDGYKVEERARKGAVIAGAIVAGVPYVIGPHVAAASGFENKSYWLVVPGVGPFLTLSTRDDSCDENDNDPNNNGENAAECLGDVAVAMLLVTDGLMQTAGGVVLAIGLTARKKVLVREQTSVKFGPMRVGRGRGLGLYGTF